MLGCVFDRMLDFNSTLVAWITSVEAIGHTFVRYALPICWDYSESAMTNYVRGGWRLSMDAVTRSIETVNLASHATAIEPYVNGCRQFENLVWRSNEVRRCDDRPAVL